MGRNWLVAAHAVYHARMPLAPARPKVVFILPAYSLGGTELQLAGLIAHRPTWARGFDIETITFMRGRSEHLTSRFEELGVKNTLLDRERMGFPRFFLRLVQELHRARATIVHTFLDSSTGTWGRLAAVLSGTRTIVHSDRSLMVGDTGVQRKLRPLLDRATKLFLPNAGAIAARLVENGVPREKITIIPSGVDLGRFFVRPSGEARAAWGVSEDSVVAGFLGRFASVKRLDVLLEAVILLPPAQRPDVLVLAGDGPEMGRVTDMVRSDTWLSEHVKLLGARDDVPLFLSGVDYLVLSSQVEGAPNAVLEAMAMGKPVVATCVSDLPEIVEGVGFLAIPGDAGSLSGAISKMQGLTSAERADLGALARERILERFDMTVVAERFWQAHRDLLQDPSQLREAAF